ncbi:MAG: O-antigen translocase [Methylococcaceae bacterium]
MSGHSQLHPVKSCGQRDSAYGQILRSSVLMGGSSLLVVLIGLIRIKGIALMVGPWGMGLWGIYLSIADLVQSLAGLGIISSGVRQMAAAAGRQNIRLMASTAWVLQRVTLVLGCLGTGVLWLMAEPVARWSFGNEQMKGQVACLSLAIVLRVMAEGQTALMQGLRRVDDLARLNIAVAVWGTVASLAWVYTRGLDGIVPALVSLAAINLLVSIRYSRNIDLPKGRISTIRIKRNLMSLLGLGSVFLASGLMVMGTAYLTRLMIVQRFDQYAAGLYQAAFALGWLYISLVLQGLGSDFYPRLTAAAHDSLTCNRLVNQQVRMAWILAVPGILATWILAPIVITVFYSTAFQPSIELLRWMCLAMGFRVFSWPLAFILMAQGSKVRYFLSEALLTALNLGLTYLGLKYFGLNGVGMALLMTHVFHTLVLYGMVHYQCGFRWTRENLVGGTVGMGFIGLVFTGYQVLNDELASNAGLIAMVISLIQAARQLLALIPSQPIFSYAQTPERRVWRYGILVLMGVWGFWYEAAYGWKTGWNGFATIQEVIP